MEEKQARAAVIRAAVRAWRAGKPHRARQTLVDAGYAEFWPAFQRAALRAARGHFLAQMASRRR